MDITEANRVIGDYMIKRRSAGTKVPFESTAWGDKYTIKTLSCEAGKQEWIVVRQSCKTGKSTNKTVSVNSTLFTHEYGLTAWRDIMKNAIDKLNEQGDTL